MRYLLIILVLLNSCSYFKRASRIFNEKTSNNEPEGLIPQIEEIQVLRKIRPFNYLSSYNKTKYNYSDVGVPSVVNDLLIKIKNLEESNLTVYFAGQIVNGNQVGEYYEYNILFTSERSTLKIEAQNENSKSTYNIYLVKYSTLAREIILYESLISNNLISFENNVFLYNIQIPSSVSSLNLFIELIDLNNNLIVNDGQLNCINNKVCSVPINNLHELIKIEIINNVNNETSIYSININKDSNLLLEEIKLFKQGETNNFIENFQTHVQTYDGIMIPYNIVNLELLVKINNNTNTTVELTGNLSHVSNTTIGDYQQYIIQANSSTINPIIKVKSTLKGNSTNSIYYTFYLDRSADVSINSFTYALSGTYNFDYDAGSKTYSKTFTNAQVSGTDNLSVTISSLFTGAKILFDSEIFHHLCTSPATVSIPISSINQIEGGEIEIDIRVTQYLEVPGFYYNLYKLKIFVMPHAQEKPYLSSLQIKSINNLPISLAPAFNYKRNQYDIYFDTVSRTVKVNASSNGSNITITHKYYGGSVQKCNQVNSITDCVINNLSQNDIIEIELNKDAQTNIYKVKTNGEYYIFENENEAFNSGDQQKDPFGEFSKSAELIIDGTIYNYLIIASPKAQKVFVYRASFMLGNVDDFTNYSLLTTLKPSDVESIVQALKPFNLSINDFGKTIAINSKFILIGAPKSSFRNTSTSPIIGQAGVVVAYKITQNGDVSPFQIIRPALGDSLSANEEFGTKLSVDKLKNELLVSSKPFLESASYRTNFYVFYNQDVYDFEWYLDRTTNTPDSKKMIKITENSITNNDIIANIAYTSGFFTVCARNTSTADDYCMSYRYEIVPDWWKHTFEYINQCTNPSIDDAGINLGRNLEVIQTTNFYVTLISDENYNNNTGRLIYQYIRKNNLSNCTYSYESGASYSSFGSGFSTLKRSNGFFALVSAPYSHEEPGNDIGTGYFNLYEIIEKNPINPYIIFDVIKTDITIENNSENYDDRIGYNLILTNNFITLTAPNYSINNQTQNALGGLVIFKANKVLPLGNAH